MLNNVPTSPLYMRHIKSLDDWDRQRASYQLLGEGWPVLRRNTDKTEDRDRFGRFLLSTGVTYLCGSQLTSQPDDSKRKLELPYYLVAVPTPIGEFSLAAETAPFATDQGKEWLIATLMMHEAAIPDSAWRNF